MTRGRAGVVLALSLCSASARAIDKPNTVFQVFQFPRDAIPRVDGHTDDWTIVPESYAIGLDQLVDSHLGKPRDPRNLDVKVKVGWVEGQNRLYFLYEAYDDYWDFGREDLHNDMFEVVVDGDLSGGPLIADMHPDRDRIPRWQLYRAVQGVFAQNWHIFTPAVNKEWAMVWGCQQPWLRALPYANAAYGYDFRPGEKGKLVLEFWITPFDYASCDGPQRSIESNLYENKLIGLSWATKDCDDPKGDQQSFWNLSEKVTMYGNASDLVRFRLMPLEPPLRRPLEARWTFTVIDPDARVVAFRDMSRGAVTRRSWYFRRWRDVARHAPRPHLRARRPLHRDAGGRRAGGKIADREGLGYRAEGVSRCGPAVATRGWVLNPLPTPLPPPDADSSPPRSPVDDFDALFRRFAPYVARTALRIIGRKSEVDDVVQDVFIQAMTRLPQVRDAAAIKGWFATITVRVCSRRLGRRRYKQWFRFAPITDIEAPTASEEQRVALINLYNLLDELPANERVAWAVRHIVGEQLEDTATICGCSLATVKRRIAAAQVKLDAKLNEA